MLSVGRQEGHPTYKKSEWWGAGVVICLGRGAYLHMAQLIPLPLTISCSSKSTLVLFFCMVPAHPGSTGQRSANWCCCCCLHTSKCSLWCDVLEWHQLTEKRNYLVIMGQLVTIDTGSV